MKYLQQWTWLAGAAATLAAAAFVAMAMGRIENSSRLAGDLGELRAFAERIASAGGAANEAAVESLVRARQERMTGLRPALTDIVGEGTGRAALTEIDRRFEALEAAARAGRSSELPALLAGVSGQVDLLLGLMASDLDSRVASVRWLAIAGIGLTLTGAVAGISANLIAARRMRLLAQREEAANRRYEALVASMQNGILVVDDADRIVYSNRALAEMLGHEADVLIGTPATRLIPAGRESEVDARLRRAALAGELVPPTLTRRLARDGTQVDVMIAVTPIVEDGRCVAMLSEFRNVSQEVSLRRQVSLEVAQREGILGAAPVPIVVIDEQGIIVAANPAIQDTLGWPPEELVSQPVSVLMPEPFASAHAGYLDHYLETGEASTASGLLIGQERPAFALHRDGHEVPISLRVAEASTPDGRRVFTGVLHDLTQQSNREGERLALLESLMKAQRDVAVGTMVGGVAHDFNNLLTAIVGALDLEISARGESTRWLDHASVAARRAATVVRRLLHAVRPEVAELHPTEVSEVVTETVELARETFDRRVHIAAHNPAPLPLVLSEPSRLEQVLLNLLLNARDATLDRLERTGPGYAPEIRIAAGVARRDDNTQTVRIIVSDNGAGMAPEVLDRLFDPFFTTKGAGKGSGLGMTMVREAVIEMDGTLAVDSNPGIGTSVTIDLPILVDDGEESGPLPLLAEERTRILLVDDEEPVRAVGVEALEREGYAVTAVASAEDAIETMQVAPGFGAVLLNLNMPGMSGWEALSWIRDREPDLPVVIVSGSVRPIEAIRRGATAALVKPFPVEELVETVRTVLGLPLHEESEPQGTW